VLQVKKTSQAQEGLQRNAMLAAFAALKDLGLVIVVDDDIDPHDPLDVEYALAMRFDATRDMVVIPDARGHEMVRASRAGFAPSSAWTRRCRWWSATAIAASPSPRLTRS
jgi:2,5-furandicarboxylate decarboxylase 1